MVEKVKLQVDIVSFIVQRTVRLATDFSSVPSTPKQLDVSFTGVLPDNADDSLLVGCKRPENCTKFYDTTAGMLALIKPCGIVVAMCEMYTCESVTQVFHFLLRTFALNVETMLRLRYLGYDRTCDFIIPF